MRERSWATQRGASLGTAACRELVLTGRLGFDRHCTQAVARRPTSPAAWTRPLRERCIDPWLHGHATRPRADVTRAGWTMLEQGSGDRPSEAWRRRHASPPLAGAWLLRPTALPIHRHPAAIPRDSEPASRVSGHGPVSQAGPPGTRSLASRAQPRIASKPDERRWEWVLTCTVPAGRGYSYSMGVAWPPSNRLGLSPHHSPLAFNTNAVDDATTASGCAPTRLPDRAASAPSHSYSCS